MGLPENLLSTVHDWFGVALDNANTLVYSDTEVPDSLYHYTDAGGAIGVLGGQFWATHHRFLNDPAEVTVLAQTLRKFYHVDGVQPSDGVFPDPSFDSADDVKMHMLGLALSPSIEPAQTPAFIVSMTTKRDDLSMWRSYGADGRGICIGLATSALEQSVRREPPKGDPPALVLPVIYDSKRHLRLAKTIVQHWWLLSLPTIMNETDQKTRIKLYTAASMSLASLIRFFGMFCKPETFSMEHEWRAVAIGPAELALPDSQSSESEWTVHFRSARSIAIPYVKMPFSLEAVTSVIVGPSADARAEHGARLLAASVGVPRAAVGRSTLGYTP